VQACGSRECLPWDERCHFGASGSFGWKATTAATSGTHMLSECFSHDHVVQFSRVTHWPSLRISGGLLLMAAMGGKRTLLGVATTK